MVGRSTAVAPPSTVTTAPVTAEAWKLARNATTAAQVVIGGHALEHPEHGSPVKQVGQPRGEEDGERGLVDTGLHRRGKAGLATAPHADRRDQGPGRLGGKEHKGSAGVAKQDEQGLAPLLDGQIVVDQVVGSLEVLKASAAITAHVPSMRAARRGTLHCRSTPYRWAASRAWRSRSSACGPGGAHHAPGPPLAPRAATLASAGPADRADAHGHALGMLHL